MHNAASITRLAHDCADDVAGCYGHFRFDFIAACACAWSDAREANSLRDSALSAFAQAFMVRLEELAREDDERRAREGLLADRADMGWGR